MTYNPFETKRRNEMIARLEKERNTHREENKRLREELESLRLECHMLRTAYDYVEKLIIELRSRIPEWTKIEVLPPVEEGMSGDLLLYISKRRDRNCNYQAVGSYEYNEDGEMVWWEEEHEFDWGNQDSWEITHYAPLLPQPE